MGATRLLLGTDSSNFPRGWDYEIFEAQSRAMLDLRVSSTDARLILEENLPRMFEGQSTGAVSECAVTSRRHRRIPRTRVLTKTGL